MLDNISLTTQESEMYLLLTKLSALNIPIVFKGGLVTKLILSQKNYDGIQRHTIDIDLTWCGEPPSIEQFVSIINEELKSINEKYRSDITRYFGNEQTARVTVNDTERNKKIFSLDIDNRNNSEPCNILVDSYLIRTVLPLDIITDKISAVSTRSLLWRTKDVVDIYGLTHCVPTSTSEVYHIKMRKQLTFSDFDVFLNNVRDIEHAYEKMRNVENKISFENIYTYVKIFLEPFIKNDDSPKIWNAEKINWDDIPPQNTN
jgi:hypothetical protein